MCANRLRANESVSCCGLGVPFVFMMASRAYEVLQWDLPVCQLAAACKKAKEDKRLETDPDNPLENEIASGKEINDESAEKKRKSFSDRKFRGSKLFSQHFDEGEDSDAHYQGCDDDDNEVVRRRRHRRKVNSPNSVRPPPLVKLNEVPSFFQRQNSDVSQMSDISLSSSFEETGNSPVEIHIQGSDSEIDFNDTWSETETEAIRERFRKLTRSLSIADRGRHRGVTLPNGLIRNAGWGDNQQSSTDSDQIPDQVDSIPSFDPLFECIFVAGIYQDQEQNCFVPFTRDQYPEEFQLPPGIEELCFPDFAHWSPHTQDRTRTYNIVLTDLSGQRTFGYCRRIQPEGDELCLPLAMCILTRHSRSRGLFSQILVELTRLYGRSEYDMKKLYKSLRRKSFPPLGHSFELKVRLKIVPSRESATKNATPSRRPSLSQILMASSNLLFRRSSRQDSIGSEPVTSQIPQVSHYRQRFKRPIDFRMDGAPICTLLSQSDILLLYSNVLRERRVVVISYSLSDLSILFDGIESLLFPLSWQHTLIPALPATRKTFLEAPTPYLIGILVEPNTTPPKPDGSVDDKRDTFWRSLKEDSLIWQDPDLFVVWISPANSTKSLLQTPSPRSSTFLQQLSRSSSQVDVLAQKKKTFSGRATLVKKLSTPGGGLMSFPKTVLDLLDSRLSLFETTLNGDGGQETDDISIARFVVLCETFLQMYNVIFSPLPDYIIDPKSWTPSHDEEEQRDFTVVDYLEACVPSDYHQFALELSESSLFEEYLRGRVAALDVHILGGSSKSGLILSRKATAAADSERMMEECQKDSNISETQNQQSESCTSQE